MNQSEPMALFVYGTLMVPEVLVALLGRVPSRREASLTGYRRYAIQGECYPAIISDANASVSGYLLTGLTEAEVEIFDAYEGDPYERTQVSVNVNGAPTGAQCYVWRSESDVRFGRDEWNLETFRTTHLARYLRALTENNS
jgi:gamma-glutamylcyclotransferase (GGCT)/AIG2-like uncharacterized protein YtfP